MIKNPQAVVQFCHEGGDTSEEEQKTIAKYEKRLKVYLFLAFVGIALMNLGPIITYYFIRSALFILGIIFTICGVGMVIIFEDLGKLNKKYKIIIGIIGAIILITGIGISFSYHLLGYFIMIVGMLWIVFCTGLFYYILKYSRHRFYHTQTPRIR